MWCCSSTACRWPRWSLKNAYTGQTATNALKQYMKDRVPKASTPLIDFNQRALVHFAADTAECYMTTRLAGDKTFFLPFNQGNQGRKGNPVAEGHYSTHYLWECLAEGCLAGPSAKLSGAGA